MLHPKSVDIDAMAVGPDLGRATTIIKRVERAVQPSVEAESTIPSADDPVLSADGSDGDDGDDGDGMTPGATDWGASLGEPFGGPDARDVPQMDDNGTGPVLDAMAVALDSAETAEPVEPAPQLASTGGRWRSRSAG